MRGTGIIDVSLQLQLSYRPDLVQSLAQILRGKYNECAQDGDITQSQLERKFTELSKDPAAKFETLLELYRLAFYTPQASIYQAQDFKHLTYSAVHSGDFQLYKQARFFIVNNPPNWTFWSYVIPLAARKGNSRLVEVMLEDCQRDEPVEVVLQFIIDKTLAFACRRARTEIVGENSGC